VFVACSLRGYIIQFRRPRCGLCGLHLQSAFPGGQGKAVRAINISRSKVGYSGRSVLCSTPSMPSSPLRRRSRVVQVGDDLAEEWSRSHKVAPKVAPVARNIASGSGMAKVTYSVQALLMNQQIEQ